jgi:hypothetical protein
MTPKEKAKELVDKMKLATDEFGYININKERHKQCALIAVDEIIKSIPCREDYGGNGWILIDNSEYWQEVKQEINLL